MSSTLPTKQDFYNAKEDLMTVDAVSNSKDPVSGVEIDTYMTRRGGQTDTLAGRLKAIGIERIGDFTVGCVVNKRNQGVLEVGGSVYVWRGALPKIVPANSSPQSTGGISPNGDWIDVGDASAYQRVISELDDGAGSSLIGYLSRTVYSKLSDKPHVKDYGAIGDGTLHTLSEKFGTLSEAVAVYPFVTSLSDSLDWAAIQKACLNTASSVIDFTGGYYVVGGKDITRSGDTELIGVSGTTVDMGGGEFLISGVITQLPNLASSIGTSSSSITLLSAPADVSTGDVVCVYNPNNYSWSQHRAYYRDGEFFKVRSVSGAVMSIYGRPRGSYLASSVQVYAFKRTSVKIDTVNFVGGSLSTKVPLIVRFATDLSVTGFTGSKSKSYQLYVDRCKDVTINGGVSVNNSTELDDDYGILIGNSADVTFIGGSHYATRHAIAIGGDDVVCGVPNRNVRIIGASLYSAHDSDAGAADTHGNCDNVQYINCVVNSASVMNGRDVKLKGCTIFGRSLADGNAVFGSEIVGGLFEITDCDVVSGGSFSPFGCIQPSMVIPTKEDLTVKVRNLTVRAPGGAAGHIVRIRVAEGQTSKINVILDGIDAASLGSLLSFLYVRCDSVISQQTPSDGMSVDNVSGPAGAYLIYPTGASMTAVRTKEMTQMLYSDVVTTVSSTAVGSDVNFRYKYSKLPVVSLSASSSSGNPFSFPGTYPATPYVYSVSSQAIRLAIASSYGNFTAGNSVRIHAAVGVSEV